MLFGKHLNLLIAAFVAVVSTCSLMANGVYRNGVGARSQAMGGTETALGQGPLGAASNPAGLAWQSVGQAEVALTGAFLRGRFDNSANSDARPASNFGGFPDIGVATPIGDFPVKFGIFVTPDVALEADWEFQDAAGGATGVTSYGLQTHRAKIVGVRSAIGAGIPIGEKLAVGASLGLVYNQNQLETPYTFQSHPALTGLKTLLDLDTAGEGWNGQVGLLWKAREDLQFGLSYRSKTRIEADGAATGTLSQQFADLGGGFAGARPDFKYDAEVEVTLPRVISAGAAWQASERWRIVTQIDWVNWKNAFDRLPVYLTNGDNADINGLLGQNTITDIVPLAWRNRVVYRLGVEHLLRENLPVRFGYSYGRSPIPDSTLTPMSAAILEHTITAGAGYGWSRYHVDFSWQWDLPVTRKVGTNALAGPEYDNSATKYSLHWLGLTFGVTF